MNLRESVCHEFFIIFHPAFLQNYYIPYRMILTFSSFLGKMNQRQKQAERTANAAQEESI